MFHAVMIAMQGIAQQIDVTDGKALGSALIANFAAAAWGDLLFQLCVGVGTAVIMGLTAYEKWQKIRQTEKDWKDSNAKSEGNNDTEGA